MHNAGSVENLIYFSFCSTFFTFRIRSAIQPGVNNTVEEEQRHIKMNVYHSHHHRLAGGHGRGQNHPNAVLRACPQLEQWITKTPMKIGVDPPLCIPFLPSFSNLHTGWVPQPPHLPSGLQP